MLAMVISELCARDVRISLVRMSSLEWFFKKKKVAAVSSVAVASEPATVKVSEKTRISAEMPSGMSINF